MSNFVFRPAVREQTPLLIGLVGPSSSGKTYSALRLAAGIQSVVGGEIAAIDTEARRMLHYADKFKVSKYLEFGPPFSSERYLEALRAAVAAGARTIIVDSMSHEHEGAGGYLEYHESELDRLAGEDRAKRDKNNFTAWIRPVGARRRLINGLLQINANFVMCFRAKEKLKLVKRDGRTEPIELGWQAIAGEEFVYEMVNRLLLPPGANGVPAFDDEAMKTGVPKVPAEHLPIYAGGKQLDESIGAALAKWAMGGSKRPERTDRHAHLIADFEALARSEGFDAFKHAWEQTPREDKAAIGLSERDRIGDLGREADAARLSPGRPTPPAQPITRERDEPPPPDEGPGADTLGRPKRAERPGNGRDEPPWPDDPSVGADPFTSAKGDRFYRGKPGELSESFTDEPPPPPPAPPPSSRVRNGRPAAKPPAAPAPEPDSAFNVDSMHTAIALCTDLKALDVMGQQINALPGAFPRRGSLVSAYAMKRDELLDEQGGQS